MQIIIDGYNLLYHTFKYSFLAPQDLRQARQALLSDLALYRRKQGHQITVVFDGWQEGPAQEERRTEKGLAVIYSPRGVKADEVIRRLAKTSLGELVIVTSDRGIVDTLERKKVLSLRVEEFQERLRAAGTEGFKDEEPQKAPQVKKGNPRKLPKAQRKKQRQWGKI